MSDYNPNNSVIPEQQAAREMESLTAVLRELQHEYYVLNRPSKTDAEYDALFDRLSELEAAYPHLQQPDSPTKRVGSDLTQEFPEVEHTLPVLSLDKAYTPQEVSAWCKKSMERWGGPLSFVVEEKIDGSSIVLYYQEGQLARAVTRGNGYLGNDITENVKTIGAVPLRLAEPVDLAVRGEIYLPLAEFNKLNAHMDPPYANPRNFAAGTLRRVKSREVARVPLNIFIYEGFIDTHGGSGSTETNKAADSTAGTAGGTCTDGMARTAGTHVEMLAYLRSLGFRLNPRLGIFGDLSDQKQEQEQDGAEWVRGSVEDIPAYLQTMTAARNTREYELDGLVVKVNELSVREALGYTGHHPRWALAYKFESPQGVTRIRGIDVQVGRTGRITPVARVEPVSIGGSTISNVTLHNQEYVNILELSLGDLVTVSRRGDVIPAVEKVLDKNDEGNPVWIMPQICPSCGGGLQVKGAHHFCVNPQCPDQVRGRIFFFIGSGGMDIDHFGPETAELLIQSGIIKDIPDIYYFDPRILLEFPGFKERKIENLKQGIEKSKSLPYRRVLPALGIPELGKSAAQLLIQAGFRRIDDLTALASAGDTAPLIEVKGIGEKTAEIILQEFGKPETLERVERLKQAGLQMEAPQEGQSSNEGQSSQEGSPGSQTDALPFFGQVWCVTGSFDHFKPRSLAEEEIEKRGGRVVSQVSGSTTHLLAGTGPGSKLEKARKAGAAILNEEKFLELLNTDANAN